MRQFPKGATQETTPSVSTDPPPGPGIVDQRIALFPERQLPLRVDAWLVPPDTASHRVADTRKQPMRLSALFGEFCHYLRVEREAAPRTIETYRWCFRNHESFVMKQIGGTVLVSEAKQAYPGGQPR